MGYDINGRNCLCIHVFFLIMIWPSHMHWANTVHLQRTGKNISPDVATRSVEIINHKKDSLSIDGQSPRFGEIEVREYEDGEWVGGQYFKSHEEANEHISLFLAHELEEDKDE